MLLINKADWRDDITKYLTSEEPDSPVETKRLQHRDRNHHIVNRLFYKGGVCAPLL